jgi:hypothetical protein
MEHLKNEGLLILSKQLKFLLVFLFSDQITFGQTVHEACKGYSLNNSKDSRSEISLGSDGGKFT